MNCNSTVGPHKTNQIRTMAWSPTNSQRTHTNTFWTFDLGQRTLSSSVVDHSFITKINCINNQFIWNAKSFSKHHPDKLPCSPFSHQWNPVGYDIEFGLTPSNLITPARPFQTSKCNRITSEFVELFFHFDSIPLQRISIYFIILGEKRNVTESKYNKSARQKQRKQYASTCSIHHPIWDR